MSLQVWLPLINDVHNQGVSGISVVNNGTTVNTSGKIGSCYAFNGSTGYIALSGNDLFKIFTGGAQQFSITMWVFHADTTRAILFGDYATSGGIGFNIELSTSHTVRFYWNGSPDTYPANATVAASGWTHVALTYDGTKLQSYINGVEKGSWSGTLAVKNKTSGEFRLGRDNRSDSTAFNGRMNDFRIYDHCLSAAEVHEIAQGLVLHYKLDYPGTNLLLNSAPHLNATTSWASRGGGTLSIQENSFGPYGYVIRSTYNTSSCGIHHQPYSTSTLVNGETYTFSGWARASKACKATWCNEWMTTSSAVDLTTDWQFFSHTGVIDTSRTYHSDVCYPTAVESGMWVEACMWKLEKGENASKWIPHTSDSIYKIFQDEMTHIDDSSGYGHHGTVHGAVSTKVDPRRYSSAIYLPIGNTDYIETDEGVGNPADAITMNIWFKSSNKTPGSDYHHCFNGLTTWVYIEMAVHKNGYMRSGLYINGTRYVANTDNNNILDGNWHMLTMTYDGANIRRYVDGVLKNTQAATGAIDRPNDRFVFGRGTSTGYYCKEASLSDARIYATALSAADILSLYHTSAKIDNLGNIHTFEFIEHQDNILFSAELSRTKLEFTNGLSRYTQSNCQVNLVEDGYHIYRPPNLTTSTNGNTMWGGLKLVNQSTDTIAAYNANRDNWWHLQQNHTYIAAFHAHGKSSNATTWGWTNNMGWGGGGVQPSPTIIVNEGIPANFNGEKDCFYIFKITDAISKPCTTAYSSYVAGTTYLSYRHLTFGWGYASTGTLGTDLYLTNFRLYDITSNMAQFTKQGQANFYDIIEQMDKCQIRKNSELLSSEFIEL